MTTYSDLDGKLNLKLLEKDNFEDILYGLNFKTKNEDDLNSLLYGFTTDEGIQIVGANTYFTEFNTKEKCYVKVEELIETNNIDTFSDNLIEKLNSVK
jgi:hypothetical protein